MTKFTSANDMGGAFAGGAALVIAAAKLAGWWH